MLSNLAMAKQCVTSNISSKRNHEVMTFSPPSSSSLVEEKAETPIVTLTYFGAVCHVCFNKVKIGTSKICHLTIKNPDDFKVEVLVKKFPFAKGFSINQQQFLIDEEEEKTVDLTWIPNEEGCFREIMLLQASSGCQKQIILLGTAILPPKKKQKSSLRREKVTMMTKTKKDSTLVTSTKENKILISNTNVKKGPQHCEEAKYIDIDPLKDIFREQQNCENLLMCAKDDPVAKTFAQKDAEHPLPATPVRRQTYVLDANNTPAASPKDCRQILKDITHGIQRVPIVHMPFSPKKSPKLQHRNMRLNRKVNILRNRRLKTNLLLKVNVESGVINSPDIRRETFVKLVYDDNFNDSLECNKEEFDDSLDASFKANLHLKSNDDDVLTNALSKSINVSRENENCNQVDRKSFFLAPIQSPQEEALRNFETNQNIKVTDELEFKVLQEVKTPDSPGLSREEIDNATAGNLLSQETIKNRLNNLKLYVNEIMTPQVLRSENISYDAKSKTTLLKPLFSPKHFISSQEKEKICASTQIKEKRFEDGHLHNMGKELFPCHTSNICCNTTLNDSDFSFLRGKSIENDHHCSTGIDSKVHPPAITSEQFSHTSVLSQESSFIKNTPVVISKEININCQLNNNIEQKSPISTTFTISPGIAHRKPYSERRSTATRHIRPKSKPIHVRSEGKSTSSKKTEQCSKEAGHSIETNSQYSNLSKQSRVIARRQLKLAQPKLILVKPIDTASTCIRHPNPFAARNVYYDEKWMIKQEFGFTRWLNFILTPPHYLSTDDNVKIDTGKFFLEGLNDMTLNLAPTKEDISFKAYTALRHLNKLRQAACIMYQSHSMALMITRLETEIENNKLCIRKDKALHADIGIKKYILSLLLCYNPLWLRIGLETIYGELICAQSNNDISSLSRFIVHRLLNNPDLVVKYAHPKVPHLFKLGYEEELKKFTLKKFLLLVYFLDNAKLARLIDHDPCLFCKNARYKSSRDLLLVFSREYLSGEGDITRHLRYLGYIVSHSQTALEEFEYAVTNLAVDMRCGLRLARVIELILKQWDLTTKLRVPTISRLQKIHNVEVCFDALKTSGFDVLGDVTPREIVDGHREKTLSLLWQIIFKTQIEIILNKEKLNEEIDYLHKNIEVQHDLAALKGYNSLNHSDIPNNQVLNDKSIYPHSEMLQLLLKWCKSVCSYYSLKVENFTVSFCDGRAFCYLIHHYHPRLLPLDAIKQKTTQTFWMQDAADLDNSSELPSLTYENNKCKNEIFEELLNNERSNLRLVFDKILELGGIPITSQPSYLCNTIPDEKVVIILLAYLNCRLMDLSQEIRAARIIQLVWRRQKLRQQIKRIKLENKAATMIQKVVKQFLVKRRQLKLQKAVLLAQTLWRRYKAKQLMKRLFEEKERLHQEKMAIIIQKIYRSYQARKAADKKRHDIVLLQAVARRWLIMRRYRKIHNAAVCIQNYFRASCLKKQEREKYITTRNNIILLQSNIRRWLLQKKYKAMKISIVLLQAHVRMWLTRNNYFKIRAATISIQQRVRSTLEARKKRVEYLKLKEATIKIQSWYKGIIKRRNFFKIKQATLKIQTTTRQYLVQKKYFLTRKTIIMFQRRWRATRLMKQEKLYYFSFRNKVIFLQSVIRKYIAQKTWLKIKHSTIIIQTACRKWIACQKYYRMKTAAIVLQRKWRGIMVGKIDRTKYIAIIKAVITLQSSFRGYICRKRYIKKKNSIIKIQAQIRMILARSYFVLLKKAVYMIEDVRSAQILSRSKRKQFIKMKKSAIIIQSVYRGYISRNDYRRKKAAVVKLQATVRCWIVQSKYKRLKGAIICLQKHYRSLLLTRNQRQYYLKLKTATIFIQSNYKSKKDRKGFNKIRNATIIIQSAFRCWSQYKKYKYIYAAVLMIQRYYRAYHYGKEERNRFLKLKSAAVTIQSIYRGMKCRNEVKRIRAACIIQSHVKQYIIRKKFMKMRFSCIVIQSFVRMHQQRKNYLVFHQTLVNMQQKFHAKLEMHSQRNKYLLMRKSCVIIQSFWRKYYCRNNFVELKLSTLVVQRHYRTLLCAKNQRQHYQLLRQSAIVLQSWIRMKLTQRWFCRQRQACILIQSYWRSYLCQKKYSQLREACLVIQQRYRALVYGRKVRYQYKTLKQSSIKIQSAVRQWLMKKKISLYHLAAIKIQAWYKKNRAFREYKRMYSSIIIIQQNVRAFLLGRKDQNRYIQMKQAVLIIETAYCKYQIQKQNKINSSVVKLQSVVRMFLIRKTYLQLRYFSIKLQSACRMKQDRIYYLQLRNATLTLQNYFRATLKRNSVFQWYHITRDACIIIQAWWRGCLVRKKISQENKAAKTIQNSFKASRTRKQYTALKKATIIIQKRWRNLQLRRATKAEFKKEWMASVKIQRFYKCYLIVKEIRKLCSNCVVTPDSSYCVLQNYYKRTKAAICIQSWYRMIICKRIYAKIHSVIELQKFARHYMKTKTAERLLLLHHQSASIIQAWYRGLCQRYCYLDTRRKVIALQSFYRGYRERTKYQRNRTLIIYLQKRWRACLIKQREIKLYARAEEAALYIQKWYKGNKIRKEYQKARLYLVTQASARCILMQGQTFLFQENLTSSFLTCKYQNCLLLKELQCIEAKQHMHLHRFLSALFFNMNAMCIQRCYRRFCLKKLAEKQIGAVLTIQHWIRSKLIRIWYIKLRCNIVLFQRVSRQYLSAHNQAAIKIQAAIRTWLVKKRLAKCHISAAVIQAAWRGYKQRCIYSGKKMAGVRSRLKKATALATEDMKLGRRASYSLYQLLGNHSLTHLLSTLTELDVVTRLSATCCQQMAEGRALDILIHIIRSCNRSVPHMELIKYCINIFLNLAKYTETVNAVWKTEGLLITVLDLMKIYREKGSDIFTKLCTLIWIFCQDPKKAKMIKENKGVREKLNSFHYLIMRKQTMSKKLQQTKSKLSSSVIRVSNHTYVVPNAPAFPIIEPDWVLCRNGIREFGNPVTAITAIVAYLGLKDECSKQCKNMSMQMF